MSPKKYRIRLTTDEQQELNALVSRALRAAAYKQTHARILLMSDESRSDGGMKDADITSALCGTVNGRANTQALCGGGGRVCAESQKATASASKETGRRR